MQNNSDSKNKGKIIKGVGGFYYIHLPDNRIFECKAKGVFRNQKIKPTVGDDVLIDFIDESFGGKVLLIGGLSLGGQILVEILSQRKDICKFAVIESALVLPMPFTSMLIKPAFSLCYSLVKTRWFAKLQFKSLHICPTFFEDYFRDTAVITKENMISFLMANANYKMKNSLSECQAKVLVLVGDREQKIMKKSSEMITQQIQNAELTILPDYFHGDLSINHADKYVTKVLDLIYNG